MARRVIIGLSVLSAPLAVAHHGVSNWDLNRDITLVGSLSGVELVNPHAWLKLEARGPDGVLRAWRCEMRSASSLRRSGWTPELFKAGTAVTVTGSPERYKAQQCYLSTIQFADGSSMDRYGQRQLPASARPSPATARTLRAPDGHPNLAGDWAAEQRVMTDPRGLQGTLVPLGESRRLKPGELPPGMRAFPGARGTPESLAADPIRAAWDRPIPVKLTEAGRKALQYFDPASRDNPRLRCEPTNILFDWTFDSVVNRVVQSADRITLRYGHMDLVREVRLDGQPSARGRPRRDGYSVGRWEGDVLVVETTGFAPGVLNADARILHGGGLRVVERFELDTTGTRLTRRYEATDPAYFEGPWRGEDVVYAADTVYSPYRCRDPGGAPSEARRLPGS
ncbi:MAG: hypothetical protein RLZZ200_1799 [Pseudomonadota bacterium]|jgi:hypothetical protein